MLRCNPERRGYSRGELPGRRSLSPVKPEKQSEELTLRTGAGLGVKPGAAGLLRDNKLWSLEYGGTLGGSCSSTLTILLEFTLSRWLGLDSDLALEGLGILD